MPSVRPFQRRLRLVANAPSRDDRCLNIANIAGKRFGELTAIKDSGKRNVSRQVIWDCVCSCGKLVERVSSSLISGKTLSCGHTKYTDEIIGKRIAAQRIPDAALRRSYNSYSYSANHRGLVFDITFEEFKYLTAQPCVYCGTIGGMLKTTKYDSCRINGVDRVDNNVGYSITNCESCCTKCNLMKRALGREEFLEQVSLIFKRHFSRSASFQA